MDNILQYIINLIIFVPIIIIFIVASIKLSNANLNNLGANKYVKALERTCLNKDSEVFVLKIGDEGCVLLSSHSKIEKIKDLSKEDIYLIEELKKEEKYNANNFIINKLKLKRNKDERLD